MSKFKPHPLAEMLPMMTDAERASLRDDIQASGQIDPAMLFEGKILDGRNRAIVCEELGIELKTKDFKGDYAAAYAYVVSRCTHRHLSDSQKACVGARMCEVVERERRPGGKFATAKGKTRDLATGFCGASPRAIQDARTILKSDVKLFGEVFNGALPINRAKRVLLREQRREKARKAAGIRRVVSISDVEIIVGDCLPKMQEMARGAFRLIFADPPYNLGFKYHADKTHDNLPPEEYLRRSEAWITEAAELLKKDGTLCWMIPEEWVAEIGMIIKRVGLHVRRLIVWHESFGQAGNNNFGRTCRYIWYATKSKTDFVFDPSSILVESKRAAVYGDKRAMPDGKVPDALWDFSRVAGTFSERIPDEGIPTQLPVKLVERCVRCFTEPGDFVLDPFGGTGTTARASLLAGRKCVTIEQSPEYAKVIRRELVLLNKEGR